jgi:(p)ppGpp synthase/HD superfamily hydrolase
MDEARPLYGDRLIAALGVAARLHAGQVKTGTGMPYVAHVLGTCSIALQYGADEDVAIGALLHDVIEDVEPPERARAEVAAFGPEVLRIVEACTDSDTHPKPPWRERKDAYMATLPAADRRVLLVALADKLHNVRAIISSVRRYGPPMWDRLNAPRADSLWYYRSVVEILRRNDESPLALLDELDRAVDEMEALA